MCKVSVVIPVYNIEGYISACVDSLLSQDIDDVEYIFVNDGSTDASRDILSKYHSIDKRIKIIDKVNGGIVTVRPVGIKAARGKYIFFLDGDDTLPAGTLQFLYDYAESHECDIVAGGHIAVRGNNLERSFQWDDKEYNNRNEFIALSIEKNNFYIWGKLIRREILNFDFYYGDSNYGEDGIFLIQMLQRSLRTSSVNRICYNYRLRENSLTSSPTAKLFIDRYKSSRFIFEYVKKEINDDLVASNIERYYLGQVYKTIYDCGLTFIGSYKKSVVDIEMLNKHKDELNSKFKGSHLILALYTKNMIAAVFVAFSTKCIKKLYKIALK
ncbi:glycosyltransferase [Klebsiella quasipneumoniae]|uniref:glycosyltransferase family 2 protein n=1 Tax=Klebsiella quasipneumoniae TaxID=1463165 RepID=UPI0022465597|nr:glycosyltransferase family 2 protein [Klebsiella quasipneumoniae]HDH1455168.1 glycosyltransferase family 2 protein [Klebsiella quasipneumoniae subsp. quasipneumoniae]MCW9400894.1 glycosyltransferase [Klebsiella quasipneumoniae]MDE1587442.1 glycosyltransferase family 2 protein [Klebsiella quasipneumoniae]MDE1597289.1 glycosyltransferase family 2 protein [Klebsiella quasipneumoniae]MDE1602671.1 glycosyltransferase family 2 protein [Klebsiella quasipneumoniae]